MSLVELIILSFALGIDCLVVSFSQGLIYRNDRIKNSLKLAVTMGLFQGLMPFISYFATDTIDEFLEPYSNMISFFIFLCLGVKFIIGAFFEKEEKICCISLLCLISLGIATSIDALFSGIILKLTDTSIIFAGLIIGLGSFIMSLGGFFSEVLLKKLPSKFLEITGGTILLLLAFKNLIMG